MKKLLLSLFLALSLNGEALPDIARDDEPQEMQDGGGGILFADDDGITRHEFPKEWDNVAYHKSMVEYSLKQTTEKELKRIIRNLNVNLEQFKQMLDNADNSKGNLINALIQDYKFKNPRTASYYYDLAVNGYNFQQSDISYVLDFYLRTRQFEKMLDLVEPTSCNFFKESLRAECYYYFGLADFFANGNADGYFLRQAKRYYPKIKELLNSQDNKTKNN